MKQQLLLNSKVFFLILIGFSSVTFGQKTDNSQTAAIQNLSTTKSNMQMTTLSTYILFDGNCRQAMEFYKSCFGGELAQTSAGESPMKNMFPESMHQKIVNAKLIAENVTISASDWLRPGQTPVKGNMVCLYLTGGKPAQLKALFDKLSVGADITDPLKPEAFGMYGALNDKFGIRWMFHTDQKD